jgi:hypothetical protein
MESGPDPRRRPSLGRRRVSDRPSRPGACLVDLD